MKVVQIEFDDDRVADELIDAMELGDSFNFNPIGHTDDNEEWINEYRFKVLDSKEAK